MLPLVTFLALTDYGPTKARSNAGSQQWHNSASGSWHPKTSFYPEALGFNMAYEITPYHLLVTSRELRELGIDDYYFALHITIDNAGSGHAALARMAVETYLDDVLDRDGQDALDIAWRRVQAGIVLADGLPTTPSSPIDFDYDHLSKAWRPKPLPNLQGNLVQDEMAELLVTKSGPAQAMHCPSRIKFDGQTVEEWLDPKHCDSARATAFLRALASKKMWVVPGSPSQSKLVKELEWGGRMFGAFTRNEVQLVREWISGLAHQGRVGACQSPGAYSRFVGSPLPSSFTRLNVAMYDDSSFESVSMRLEATAPKNSDLLKDQPMSALPRFSVSGTMGAASLSALWITHLTLLDQFPLHTAKFASPLGACILRIIRAQLGFDALHRKQDVCAGTDAGQATNGLDLWDVCPGGLGERANAPIASLARTFCEDMEVLRTRPYKHQGEILGVTYGFARLYDHEALGRTFDHSYRHGLQGIGGSDYRCD